MYLWRVSLKTNDVWSRFYNKKLKPIYAVSATKESVTEYVEKHIKEGLKVKSVSKLGEQLATYMYSGNDFK